MDSDSQIPRRRFLQRAAGLTLTGAGALMAGRPASALRTLLPGEAGPGQAPAFITADRARPSTAFGAAAGDVDAGRAIVWSRTDRPARLIVEYATTESFTDPRRIVGPAALETTDFTARVDLSGLPAGQRIFYRARFESLADLKTVSEPVTGTFTTAPDAAHPRDVTIAWTADVVGQGWGINPDDGGLRLFETMRKAGADLFLHCGDTIYADQPLLAEVTLDDGRVWKNIVTPEKSKVAETLDEFRGNYRYNLMDEHVRRFNASTSQFVIWDDHEVMNNWWPTGVTRMDKGFTERSVPLLAARARHAFFDYQPLRVQPADPERLYRAAGFGPAIDVIGFDMRSYRGANSSNDQAAMTDETRLLGARQVEWLKQRLAASKATWKVIVSGMPLGLVVGDYDKRFEAVAQGNPGRPLGRELEIADLLKFIRDRKIRNVVFVTGDVHYCAAHHYDPARAAFTEFAPFWEFVAGPAHAGTFGPNTLDKTFGPELKFLGIPAGMKPNRPPSDGFQFFGTLRIDAKTRAMTAKLHNLAGDTLFSVELPAERA